MINTQVSKRADSKPTARIWRIGQPGFWLLFVLEGLLIAGMLVFALYLLVPARAPLAQTADYATVRAAIQARLSGAVDDPPVEVAPGISARTSNVGGFTLNGYTYYYYREGQPGFDPLSRGAITRDQVELVSREQIGREAIVIYRMPSKERATN